jgi:hypothetical protein
MFKNIVLGVSFMPGIESTNMSLCLILTAISYYVCKKFWENNTNSVILSSFFSFPYSHITMPRYVPILLYRTNCPWLKNKFNVFTCKKHKNIYIKIVAKIIHLHFFFTVFRMRRRILNLCYYGEYERIWAMVNRCSSWKR